MSKSQPSEIDIDELATLIELRIKRTEQLLSDEEYEFGRGKEMRLTGIKI